MLLPLPVCHYLVFKESRLPRVVFILGWQCYRLLLPQTFHRKGYPPPTRYQSAFTDTLFLRRSVKAPMLLLLQSLASHWSLHSVACIGIQCDDLTTSGPQKRLQQTPQVTTLISPCHDTTFHLQSISHCQWIGRMEKEVIVLQTLPWTFHRKGYPPPTRSQSASQTLQIHCSWEEDQ